VLTVIYVVKKRSRGPAVPPTSDLRQPQPADSPQQTALSQN